MARLDLLSLNKFERIQEMQRWGLNTPEYVFFKRGSGAAFKVWAQGQQYPNEKRVSLRFFTPAEEEGMGAQPHLPHITWFQAYSEVQRFIADYDIIITPEAIDPKHCLVCGNLQMELHSIDGYGIAIFEYRWGAGTVRRVADWCLHLECNLHAYPRDEQGGCLWLARAKAAALHCPYWNQVIFEWSFYSRPVGCKHSPLIFWEMRRRR